MKIHLFNFALFVFCNHPTANTFTMAMMANPNAFEETQPDGTTVMLQLHGDENHNYLTDSNGYTVLRNQVGSFVYAVQQAKGNLVETPFQVGQIDPHMMGVPQGFQPIPDSNYVCNTQLCQNDSIEDYDDDDDIDNYDDGHYHHHHHRQRLLTKSHSDNNHRHMAAITTGTLKNLVIPLLWSDHIHRSLPSRDDLDILMNHNGPHNALCPTGSVRDVYLENSYGQLLLESTVVDWVLMDNTELYYAAGERGLTVRIHDAIRFALNYLELNNLVDFADFDSNGDGMIDSITFLHSGYGAEWGGTDSGGRFYTDRIWSHKWGIYTAPFTSSDGVTVFNYHISPAMWGVSGNAIGRIGVIAHETGHFLGLPDLYDRNGGGYGIGSFGLMANSWGFDGSQYYPPHLSAWCKILLGWLTPTTPTEGYNRISASESESPNYPQVFKIEAGYPNGEYLLIENRQPIGFDKAMRQGGLVIYHIDETAGYYDEGYPGQVDWPWNGNHYRVSILQADGLFELERGINLGNVGDVFHAGGVNQVVSSDQILSSWIFPNTDAYQDGNVYVTTVSITEISSSALDMSFEYYVGDGDNEIETPFPTSSPTMEPETCLAKGMPCTTKSDCCSNRCRRTKKKCR